MTYLVDSNVLSEPTKPSPDRGVIDWFSNHEAELAVDPIILGEILAGILSLAPGRKRTRLQEWFAANADKIRCLASDAEISRRWATLVVDLKRAGKALPIIDSMIAATALTYGLTVATRNVRDFKRAGADVVDPFAEDR